jgi:uncharacterized phage protein gp47/JayE
VRRARLTRLVGSFYTDGGAPVEPSVTNASDSSGGTDREGIESARYAAIDALRATERTVSREDFELHAQEVSGVARALCHTRVEDSGIPYNTHYVYTVPVGGGNASAALLTAVETYVTQTKPCDGGLSVVAVRATYSPVTLTLAVWVRKGTDTTNTAAEALAAVEALWDPENRDAEGNHTARWGYPVFRAQVIAALAEGVTGFSNAEVSSPASDSSIAANRFPSLAATPSITVIEESV